MAAPQSVEVAKNELEVNPEDAVAADAHAVQAPATDEICPQLETQPVANTATPKQVPVGALAGAAGAAVIIGFVLFRRIVRLVSRREKKKNSEAVLSHPSTPVSLQPFGSPVDPATPTTLKLKSASVS